MTDAQRTRLFQPFEQLAEAPRQEGGTGLGLAISRQLVRLMGSEIEVASTADQGSRFWFQLELPTFGTEVATPAEARPVSGYVGVRKKVLVVDDAPANRAVLADALAALGFEVHEAENGAEGLAKSQAVVPDLILMDVTMPVMDGLEATRRLRRIKALKDKPVIVVSASTSAADQEQALAAGANSFLAKPIELDGLLKVMGGQMGLTWIYQPVETDETTEATLSGPMVPPPPEELRVLLELALRGNMREIRAHADHLATLGEACQPFAEKLRRMADRYQSKAILTLVKHYVDD